MKSDLIISVVIALGCGYILCHCLASENPVAIVMTPIFAILGLGIIFVAVEGFFAGRGK